MTNYCFAACGIVLLLNTLIFCKMHGGCSTLPPRSALSSTPHGAVAHTEIAFITLLSALVPMAITLQKAAGDPVQCERMAASFLLPFIVALCFSFDIKRFGPIHVFFAMAIVGVISTMAFNSWKALFFASLYAFFAAWQISKLRKLERNTSKQEAEKNKQQKNNKKGGTTAVLHHKIKNVYRSFWGGLIFFPAVIIMRRNFQLIAQLKSVDL